MKRAIQKILIQCAGRDIENFMSKTLVFDNMEMTIKGSPDAVERMQGWLLAAWKKEDHEELMRPFFKQTKPGKPIYFPLIGEEEWEISITK